MLRPVSLRLRALVSAAAIAAAFPLAACNQPAADTALATDGLPDLPATMPLALGEPTQPVYAPAAYDMPAAPLLPAAQVADPDEYYAYADDAWGFEDSVGYAPPDYGFYDDEVEPWAWQGYDDSLMFVEPLEVGYRTYFYRPGEEYPYFIRDPDCGYGYDGGRLVVIYNSYGGVIPYADYGPRFAYASRYYSRGHDLYWASRQRHPVIAANWIERRPLLVSTYRGWMRDRERHPEWRAYHDRVAAQSDRHWQPERARRQADAVRFAAWSDHGFRTAAPPRAIPADWTRAKWARDERRFAPPATGILGAPAERQRAVTQERTRVAALAADRREQARGAAALRRVALVQHHSDRRAETGPALVEPRPSDVRAERQIERRNAMRDQVEVRRQARAETRQQAETRRAQGEQRQRDRVAERHAAEQRQAVERRQRAQAEARQQVQARRADPERRQQVEARHAEARQAAEQRQQGQAEARRQVDARRSEAEQRQRAGADARQQAQQRQQGVRQRVQERAQQREQAEQRRQQQEVRSEPPQRDAKPEWVARADPADQPDPHRGRRQR